MNSIRNVIPILRSLRTTIVSSDKAPIGFNSTRLNSLPSIKQIHSHSINSPLIQSLIKSKIQFQSNSNKFFSNYSKSFNNYYSNLNSIKVNKLIRKVNNLDSNSIIFALIAANVSIYLTWAYAKSIYQRFGDPTLYNALNDNFTTSLQNVKAGRIWCLLLSAFSHESSGHILMNMVGLYFIGGPVIAVLGNVGFLSLYLFSGISSSIFSLTFNSIYSRSPQNHASHGASGATYGTLAYFAAANPRTTFLIFFVIPAPAWLCVGGLFAYDLYSTFGRRSGLTDSAGHVGGILAGLTFFLKRGGRF